jgi:hypothetical protein
MSFERGKKEELSEGISFLNQLLISIEQSELKLEQAYKRNKPEQVKAIKEFILKMQKRLSEELI